jgi:hypothetical protein
MSISANLRALIDAATPYWAGEAEVVRTYWSWNRRTRETDRKWLARQCYKEFRGFGAGFEDLGPFLGQLEGLKAAYGKIDVEVDRHEVLDIAATLYAEFAHYCAFADVHDRLALPGEPKLNPAMLEVWPEEDELARVRRGHIQRHGALGTRAAQFTEGGYCTLFSEGMKLRERPTPGHEATDRLIAEACARVYDDEFGHMLKGIFGLDEERLPPGDWRRLTDMSIEQLRHRILMRNAQFEYVVPEARIKELLAGQCRPLPFDYERAKIA